MGRSLPDAAHAEFHQFEVPTARLIGPRAQPLDAEARPVDWMASTVRTVALRLYEGTNVATAVGQLSDCMLGAENLAAFTTGQDEHLLLSSYLRWVTATERQLRSVFVDSEMVDHLRSPAYWAVRDAVFQPRRVTDLIIGEAKKQTSWLQAVTGRLQNLQRRLEAAPGKATVVDTNVLLHYQAPWDVDWQAVVGEREVRLVLPLRVIEELDEKKYTGRDHMADRARRLLSQLWETLGDSAGAPVPLRGKVTIEVPVEEGRRVRSLDADEEILDECEQLRNVGQVPILVTGDTGMSLRANARRLDVRRMPEKYLRGGGPAGKEAPV